MDSRPWGCREERRAPRGLQPPEGEVHLFPRGSASTEGLGREFAEKSKRREWECVKAGAGAAEKHLEACF